MKIKLDENLPARLVPVLERYGHETDTVWDEGLTGQADEVLWQTAQRAARFLITQDLDFSDASRFSPGTHVGLLLVRLREPGANALLARIGSVAADMHAWHGCFVVLTDHKIRIKRPAGAENS